MGPEIKRKEDPMGLMEPKRGLCFRYFENFNLAMLAKWRSFITTKSLLEKGLIWRGGNGKSIKIWSDKWVPQPIFFKIQSSVTKLQKDAKAAELIDQETKQWNEQLLKEVFSSDEIDIISKISISPCGSDDKLI